MAGDWIPVRDDLCSVREVLGIAKRTGKPRQWVVGCLVQFWGWAQNETADGKLVDADVDALVDLLGIPKQFFIALVEVGWLLEGADDHPGVTIPNFDRWLSENAKRRLQKNKRQSAWREGRRERVVDVDRETSTTLQNRTEENINKREGAPPKVLKKTVAPRIFLTDQEIADLKTLAAAEGVSADGELKAEIKKASDYLLDKGKASKDSAAFLRNWIRRAGAFKRRAEARRGGGTLPAQQEPTRVQPKPLPPPGQAPWERPE